MKLLYCIDERGLKGGAHIATELLMAALKERGHQVDVMEAVRRDTFWGLVYRAYARLFNVLSRRLPRTFLLNLNLQPQPLFLRDPFGRKRRLMRRYDTVCVGSESSVFSALVVTLPATVRKVQMIHTNYPMWAKLVHRDTAADERIFRQMDCIACVGRIGARQFEEMFPSCKGKVVPFYNLIEMPAKPRPPGEARTPPLRRCGVSPHHPHLPLRLISLARINDTVAKDGPRMIRVAKRLKEAGIDFVWDNYGGSGNGSAACQQEVERLGLKDVFRIHPFDPQARERIAEADLFVLLSHYEGLPNVIYESMLSGTPVFATRVGGIPEQIEDGVNGWLAEDDEARICEALCRVLSRPDRLTGAAERLRGYAYDNESIVRDHERQLCF